MATIRPRTNYLQGKSLGVSASGSGTASAASQNLLLSDDFSSYTVDGGAAQFVSSGPWSARDGSDSNINCRNWPGPSGGKSLALIMTGSESAMTLQYNPDPDLTEVYFEWLEWRPSTYDAGSYKDMRVTGGSPIMDIYWTIGNTSVSGRSTGQDVGTLFRFTKQGTAVDAGPTNPADGSYPNSGTDVYGDATYVWPLEQEVLCEMRLKLNTVGQKDGACTFWADGVEIYSNTGVEIRTSSAYLIETVRFGMTFSNGTAGGPASETIRYIKNAKIGTSRINSLGV